MLDKFCLQEQKVSLVPIFKTLSRYLFKKIVKKLENFYKNQSFKLVL